MQKYHKTIWNLRDNAHAIDRHTDITHEHSNLTSIKLENPATSLVGVRPT